MSDDTLPWDRYGEPATEPEPELPYIPPQAPTPPTPEPAPPPENPAPAPPPPAVDLDDVLNQVWPVIKNQVADYLRGTMAAGFNVDHTHPRITAHTAAGRELVVADAKSRSWRTLIQGLLIDLFFAVVVLLGTVTQADVLDKASWAIFFVLLGKTLIQTSVAYFMRLKITPTMRTEGTKLAIMPVPRPMVEQQRKEHP